MIAAFTLEEEEVLCRAVGDDRGEHWTQPPVLY